MSSSAGHREVGFSLGAVIVSAFVCALAACSSLSVKHGLNAPEHDLEAMSVTWGANLKFERGFMESFGLRNGIKTQLVANSRLAVYRQLLSRHTPEPDMLELDVIWPSILADDLVDLAPYLNEAQRNSFIPKLLNDYMVHGRLVALPVYVDMGVLYYRPELLEKYGFHNPPETWGEMETMAGRIQAGERRNGNKDFWGYVWQGAPGEPGTCNFLEWQTGAGAGNFIEPDRTIHVRDARFEALLARTTGWIGTISPPAEYVYREDDSLNLWDAGQTAFMRNWASAYGHVLAQPGNDHRHFAVAPLPAGVAGHRGTMGGMGVGISKYAADRELAVKALLELTGTENDLKRQTMTEGIPMHSELLNHQETMDRNALLAVSKKLLDSMVSRPSLVTGDKYEAVSQEYSAAVNSVLRRKSTPAAAMAELEKKLVRITGLPVRRD